MDGIDEIPILGASERDQDLGLSKSMENEREGIQITNTTQAKSVNEDYAQDSSFLDSFDAASEQSTEYPVLLAVAVGLEEGVQKGLNNFQAEKSGDVAIAEEVFSTVPFCSKPRDSQEDKGESSFLFCVSAVPEPARRLSDDLQEEAPYAGISGFNLPFSPPTSNDAKPISVEPVKRVEVPSAVFKELNDGEKKSMTAEAVESTTVEAVTEEAFTISEELSVETFTAPMNVETVQAEEAYSGSGGLKVEISEMPIREVGVEEAAESVQSRLDDLRGEKTCAMPISEERVDEAGEVGYSRLEESHVEEDLPMSMTAKRVDEVAGRTHASLEEFTEAESFVMPVHTKGVEEAAEMTYSRLEETNVGENLPMPIVSERVEEVAGRTSSRLEELKAEDIYVMPRCAEKVEEAAEMTYSRLEELKMEENLPMPMSVETVEEMTEMTNSRLEEFKMQENLPIPKSAEIVEETADMAYSSLEEWNVQDNPPMPKSTEIVEEPAEITYSSLEDWNAQENLPMPIGEARVEKAEMTCSRLEELKVEKNFPVPSNAERMGEANTVYSSLDELKVEENVPIPISGEKMEEETETAYLGLEKLKTVTFSMPTTSDGVKMVSQLKSMEAQTMETLEEVQERIKLAVDVGADVKPLMVDTMEKMEAKTEIKGAERMDSLDDLGLIPKASETQEERDIPQQIKLDRVSDALTSQSIMDVNFPLGGNVGFIAPVDHVTEERDPDEMAGSMMNVQENNEGALEDDSRRGGRKRGRPPKAQAGRTPPKKKEKEEEDVCFICFDGGNLVLCDRRGCPKVYHPSCVNRDEAFFRSKGKWNCGWHICSICEKAAHYMCFTCTYSLCKSCIKDSQFVSVRGNKGLCDTCRSTVILIETNEPEKKSVDGVNFDDRSSWEYLFKDYWSALKGKLSITLEEVSMAKNPWKGSSLRNEDQSDEPYDANNDMNSSSDSSSGHHQRNKPTKKKVKKSSKAPRNGQKATLQLPYKEDTSSLAADSDWASNELLEFVGHMRRGDKSTMCQFDVHTLLLEYIKQNNLRDPRRKSQIVCDARLETLFGKARVGHFEMLKLLESHFLTKESSLVATDDNQGSVLDPDSSQMDNESNSNSVLSMGSDKKQKSRKRSGKGERQSNVDEYAAIDVHNITLLYLKRNLMEELLGDPDFQEKVVGSFVRIRISGVGLKKDMYRLVPVTGTARAEDKYKSGRRATNIALEILNLSKTEVVSIDSISNQEFTEEECKRLRQSIKCGLINRLKVGEIQEKALALQSVRVNESLESEKLRISHLRDRASEKGHRKELRECVEKLQLLNSPEEHSRRLREVPMVNVDPKMNPNYESDEEDIVYRRPESLSRSRDSYFSTKRRESTHSLNGSTVPISSGYSENNGAAAKSQQKENPLFSPKPSMDLGLTSAGASKSPLMPTIDENEKIWYYKDPSSKIQGPFSMTQLRKWNTTGYFPSSLRIWKTSDKEDEAILLTDALLGKFQKSTLPPKMPSTLDGGRNELTSQTQDSFLGKQYQLSGQGGASPSQVNAWGGNPRAAIINTHSSGDFLSPTPKSEQVKFDVDSKRKSFEAHQKYNFMSAPYEDLPGSGVGQNNRQNPDQARSSTVEQRSELSMPSPTPTVEPSRYDPGKQTEQAVVQDTTVNVVMGSGPASMAAGLPGHGGAAWGALMQGNSAGVWVTQPNPAASISWAPPPPLPPPPPPPAASTNVNNLLWMAQAQAHAQAQAQAQAYPGWPTPVPGGLNLNAAWYPAAPTNLQQVPNWGLPPQPAPPNPNPGWALPSTESGSSAGGSGGSQAPPPNAGICMFYERGHCKKGDSCNYMHYR